MNMIKDYSLPASKDLPIHKLSAVFNNTTTSYKFFWFLSILDILEDKNHKTGTLLKETPLHINISEIILYMVINAWYPLYCRLSLGLQDRIFEVRQELKDKYNLPEDADKNNLIKVLKKEYLHDISPLTKKLQTYVPFKFIQPWVTGSDKKVIKDSNDISLRCIYSFNDNNSITIKPLWMDYLIDNLKILREFTYWNLLFYLQRRNPHDHFIANKIVKPEKRETLTLQRNIWNYAIDNGVDFICPYTNTVIQSCNYDLDHFIPWRYVCNNLMWNLTPADSGINRSKGDKLPNIESYIKQFAFNQRALLQVLHEKKPHIKGAKTIMDDYLSLGTSIEEIAYKDNERVIEFYDNLIRPFFLQASSMGFEIWRDNYPKE